MNCSGSRSQRPTAARGRARPGRCSRRPIADAEDAGFAVRPQDHGLASIQRDEQAGCPALDPHWRPLGQRRRSKGFPIGAGLLDLDRLGAKAKLEWGQGQTLQYQQTGSAQPVHSERSRGGSLRQDPAPGSGRGSPNYWHGNPKVAAIALANKLARMAWAMTARGERYKEPVALAA
jgi:hypothetical protein